MSASVTVSKPESEDKKLKMLTGISNYLSKEDLEKLSFLMETVLPYGLVVGVSSLLDIQDNLDRILPDNASIIILKRFFKTIHRPKYSRQLETLVSSADTYTFPSPEKLYFYELVILVCDNLGTGIYFKRLKDRISNSQLGCSKEDITTPVVLFRKLIQKNTLNFEEAAESLKLVKKWLDDIGRNDIIQLLNKHPRPNQEQGMLSSQHDSLIWCNMEIALVTVGSSLT